MVPTLLSQPTLRRRMILSLAFMMLGFIAVGVASIVAINGLHQDLSVSVQGYRQLRQLFNVGLLVSRAGEAVSADSPRPLSALNALQSALAMLKERSDSGAIEGPPQHWIDESARSDCERLLTESIHQLMAGSTSFSLNPIFGRLSNTAGQVRQSIADAQAAADRRRKIALIGVVSGTSVVILGAMLVGILQYRRVMVPVQKIGDGVRAFTQGRLDRRIQITGDCEFVVLAANFNQMAEELSALYRNLEEQVAVRTRQLIRSEQLASVGYLAAGVAHEINNPLGIIAGYGERAMQQLSQGLNDASMGFARNALVIICEETFRCKQITSRLLSLARPASEGRELISVPSLAEAVIATLSGLSPTRSPRLQLTVDPDSQLNMFANEGQIKQLLLNLIINALDAVDPATGEITIAISGRRDELELRVSDNGHGMTLETLDRIFQPFFSDKRGQQRGTGLGLSIAQAIVAEHGGRIEAHSAGPGAGSTFVVRLPMARKEAASAQA